MDKTIIVALEKVEAHPSRYEITLNEEQAQHLISAITGAFGYEISYFSKQEAEETIGRSFSDKEYQQFTNDFYDGVVRLFQDYEA